MYIDRSFGNGVDELTDEAALVKTMIDMGSTLRLETVAEGVEELAPVQRLRGMRCRYARGYHFAAPMPAEALSQFVASRAPLS